MAFDLYFAGSKRTKFEDQFQRNNCNRLFTFADKSNRAMIEEQNHDGKIFMDSGAFSVHTKGKVIMPAFVNMHEHIYSAMARGLSIKGYHGSSFLEILDGQWWTMDRHLNNNYTY